MKGLTPPVFCSHAVYVRLSFSKGQVEPMFLQKQKMYKFIYKRDPRKQAGKVELGEILQYDYWYKQLVASFHGLP